MSDAIWWTTRPTRDLHDLPDSLRAFADIAEGAKWSGNRELHKRLEVENPAKTSHSGTHGSEGSGGRTWAAWLRLWGMWYDGERVTLTDAARLILGAKRPEDVHKQIVHMIMTFQITSSYHEGLPRLDYSGFRVFPFRLMLEMLLDERVAYLEVDEIALFLLPIRDRSEYERAVSEIAAWREETRGADAVDRREMLMQRARAHMKRHHKGRSDSPGTVGGHWRSAKDVANTFAVNMSYITEIKYDGRRGRIYVPDGDAAAARVLLEKYEDAQFSGLFKYSEATFARKYGTRFDRRKASGKHTRPRTRAQKRLARILAAVEDARRGADGLAGDAMLEAVMARTGYRKEEIVEALGADPAAAGRAAEGEEGQMESHYIRCAGSGEEHAEFERVTRRLFELMGFRVQKARTERRGGGSAEVDGLVLSDESGMSGIIECKGGGKYSFPVGDCEKMKHVYIKGFASKKIGGRRYDLDFFTYVVGTSAGGMANFEGIARDTGVRGSVIYARDLFRLYREVDAGRLSPMAAWRMLKCNGRVTQQDIEEEAGAAAGMAGAASPP